MTLINSLPFLVPRPNKILSESLVKSYDKQMAQLQRVRDALQNGIDRNEARSSFLWTHDQNKLYRTISI